MFQGVNIVAPRSLGSTPDEDAIAAAMPKAHIVFNELSRLLGSMAYFANDNITPADMLVASHLDFLAETPEWQPLAAATPNLVDRLHRMHDRASFKTTTWQRVADLAKAALTERDNPLLGSGGQLTQRYPQRPHDVRDKSAFLGWMPALASLNASGDLTIVW